MRMKNHGIALPSFNIHHSTFAVLHSTSGPVVPGGWVPEPRSPLRPSPFRPFSHTIRWPFETSPPRRAVKLHEHAVLLRPARAAAQARPRGGGADGGAARPAPEAAAAARPGGVRQRGGAPARRLGHRAAPALVLLAAVRHRCRLRRVRFHRPAA